MATISTRHEGRPASVAISPELTVDPPKKQVTRIALDRLVAYLPGFWAAGSTVTLLLLAAGLIGVERLRRSSRILADGVVAERCQALAKAFAVNRRVIVGVCDRLAGPILVGIIRPMILLPPAAISGWSPDQLEMVLLHELAHLRRWDNLVNLAQRVVESLLFFHPVTWWLSSWVRLEREFCCDRLVIDRMGQPSAYAEMLVTLGRAKSKRDCGDQRDGRPLFEDQDSVDS